MSDREGPRADGSVDAFAGFYRAELAGQVRRAFLLLGDGELANDIVHDAMTAVFARWAEVTDPGAYLNRAVLNGCRDVGRRRVRGRRLATRLAEQRVDQPAVDPLGDVLARLPFNQRAAVVLRFYGGFTTNEIADALGCRPGSVGPWIDRGLTAMRRVL